MGTATGWKTESQYLINKFFTLNWHFIVAKKWYFFICYLH
ncbi:hypothetical protein C8N47_1483, partial [Mangrovibacterium marinum]